jgi:hypothetical protein
MGASVLAPRLRSFARVALGLCVFACQTPPEDLREWRPTDHRNTETSGAAKKGQVSANPGPNLLGVDQVVVSTWQNNCVSCHGRIGAGDGPQAAMYQPRDLTDAAFQSSVTDEQLLASIQRGKGKMPGFALPESTALGLVKLVRLIGNAAAGAASSGSAAATSAPAPSATSTSLPTGAATGHAAAKGAAPSAPAAGAPDPHGSNMSPHRPVPAQPVSSH